MKPGLLPIVAIIFSVFFWVVDSAIDVFIFGEHESISENLVSPEPVELWMRLLVVSLLISFSLFAKNLLSREVDASTELKRYKDQLEEIISQRTKELRDEIEVRKKAEEKLETIATIDPLTSLFNRRKFDEMAMYEMKREQRYKSGLFLIICDIDKFKNVNDKYGHAIGDQVLIKFAEILKSSIRKTDLVARWGGEEFVVLISNTEIDQAGVVADKLRGLVEKTAFEQVGQITASFGVAYYEGNDTVESLISRADKALYKAKDRGRNCVEIWD